jgi:hypothetical protein
MSPPNIPAEGLARAQEYLPFPDITSINKEDSMKYLLMIIAAFALAGAATILLARNSPS